jgi:hypothetical protein
VQNVNVARPIRRPDPTISSQAEEAEQELPDEWTETEPPGSPEALPLDDLRRDLDKEEILAGEARCGV